MHIYAMSDIHGCLPEFLDALELVEPRLKEKDAKLILLGDYVHGPDSYGVLKRIISLQRKYGRDKVIALMGNHEELVCDGRYPISGKDYDEQYEHEDEEDEYISWMMDLPRYHVEGKTIFVHAGIDEEAEDMWELGTDDYTFTEKFPAQTGRFHGGMTIVAGHVGTSTISGDPRFHDIYFDGESHYYIDGSTLDSGIIPILMVDTEADKYYSLTDSGLWPVEPYSEEY